MRALRHLLLSLLLLSSGPLPAADLTEAQVRGTLGALQELEATFGQDANQAGSQSGLPPFANGQADADRAKAILRRHGFDSVEEWTEISQRVVKAYMAVKFVDEQPDAEQEMARARAEIEASDLDAERKRQMLAAIEQTLASARAMGEAPEADVATVRGMLPELDAYFDK